MTNDEKYMQRCLQLAANGLINAAPNPMVGAVISRPHYWGRLSCAVRRGACRSECHPLRQR